MHRRVSIQGRRTVAVGSLGGRSDVGRRQHVPIDPRLLTQMETVHDAAAHFNDRAGIRSESTGRDQAGQQIAFIGGQFILARFIDCAQHVDVDFAGFAQSDGDQRLMQQALAGVGCEDRLFGLGKAQTDDCNGTHEGQANRPVCEDARGKRIELVFSHKV